MSLSSDAPAAAKDEKKKTKGDKMKDEEDEEDDEDDEGEAIPLLTCLFCNKEFNDMQKCLDHMLKHGFFVPYIDFLVDLEGMLEYLGEKVSDFLLVSFG